MLRLSSVFALSALLTLSACDRGTEQPEKGVDTTLPDNPAKLTGQVSFPSDAIPDDLQVCAESVKDNTTRCNAQIKDGSYTLEVPAGTYRVFARTAKLPDVRAYYSKFVECGLFSWCSSHEPIPITVQEGETHDGVNPGDWYAQTPTASDGAASPSDVTNPELATENDVDENDTSSEPQDTDLNDE